MARREATSQAWWSWCSKRRAKASLYRRHHQLKARGRQRKAKNPSPFWTWQVTNRRPWLKVSNNYSAYACGFTMRTTRTRWWSNAIRATIGCMAGTQTLHKWIDFFSSFFESSFFKSCIGLSLRLAADIETYFCPRCVSPDKQIVCKQNFSLDSCLI